MLDRVFCSLQMAFLLAAPVALAGEVGSEAFTLAATIDDFTDVGGNTIGVPLVRGYGQYTGSSGVVKWTDLGPLNTFGFAIATFGDFDFIDLELNVLVDRVGGWIGVQDTLVEFFDDQGNELGQVFVDYQFEPVFVAWEDTSVGIKRVRFTDVQGGAIMSIDRVTLEPVGVAPQVPVFSSTQHWIAFLAVAVVGVHLVLRSRIQEV